MSLLSSLPFLLPLLFLPSLPPSLSLSPSLQCSTKTICWCASGSSPWPASPASPPLSGKTPAQPHTSNSSSQNPPHTLRPRNPPNNPVKRVPRRFRKWAWSRQSQSHRLIREVVPKRAKVKVEKVNRIKPNQSSLSNL